MSTVEALKARTAKDLKTRIKALRQELKLRKKELIALALEALPPARRPSNPVMGGWKCEPDLEREVDPDDDDDIPDIVNVAGFCIYDSGDECCLFCGAPDERQ